VKRHRYIHKCFHATFPTHSLFLTPTTLPPIFSRHSLGLDSPSSPLPVSPSLQQGPSGRLRTLSSPWHSPPLGLWENLLHSQVKWKSPLHTIQQAAHAAMLDGRDWLAEERGMLYLSSLSAAVPFSITFFHPSLARSWPACGWGSEKEGDWEQEIKRLYGLSIKQTSLSWASVHLPSSLPSFSHLALHSSRPPFMHLCFSLLIFLSFNLLYLWQIPGRLK